MEATKIHCWGNRGHGVMPPFPELGPVAHERLHRERDYMSAGRQGFADDIGFVPRPAWVHHGWEVRRKDGDVAGLGERQSKQGVQGK